MEVRKIVDTLGVASVFVVGGFMAYKTIFPMKVSASSTQLVSPPARQKPPNPPVSIAEMDHKPTSPETLKKMEREKPFEEAGDQFYVRGNLKQAADSYHKAMEILPSQVHFVYAKDNLFAGQAAIKAAVTDLQQHRWKQALKIANAMDKGKPTGSFMAIRCIANAELRDPRCLEGGPVEIYETQFPVYETVSEPTRNDPEWRFCGDFGGNLPNPENPRTYEARSYFALATDLERSGQTFEKQAGFYCYKRAAELAPEVPAYCYSHAATLSDGAATWDDSPRYREQAQIAVETAIYWYLQASEHAEGQLTQQISKRLNELQSLKQRLCDADMAAEAKKAAERALPEHLRESNTQLRNTLVNLGGKRTP